MSTYIRQGFGGQVLFTEVRKRIRYQFGGSVVATLDGQYIRSGFGDSVAYTIEGAILHPIIKLLIYEWDVGNQVWCLWV